MAEAGLRIVIAEPKMESVRFRADMASLCGTLHRPGTDPRAAIVLHGATGVPQSYYQPFARWLAEQGYACLTYDYRDFGASAKGPLRQSKAKMADWGLGDQPAAQAELERLVPDTPVWVIGHSLGGLMVPFHSGADRISRLIGVASGPVHLTDHPFRARPKVRAFWHGPGPLATLAFGYLPGAKLGLGADIPSGVYWQWRRWCNSHGFFLRDIGGTLPMPDWPAMRGRAKFVAVADDEMVPPAAVWRLMQYYPEALKTQLTLRPAEFGLKKIGHIAAFSARNRAVWPEILA